MDTIQLPLLSTNRPSPFEDPPGPRNVQLKRPSNKIPLSLRTWAVVSVTLFMIAIAAAIEIALLISEKNGGFSTGNLNIEEVQWWSGFIPTLAIGPFVWIWRIVDIDLRRMQPYVIMSQGPTKPEQSVLLNLEHNDIFTVLFSSLRHGQYLILASSLICIINVLFHPIAGTFFLIKPGVTMSPLSSPIRGIASIGLNPLYKDVTSFVAASGFAEAAAFHNLSDPPFIQNGWAVAQFKPPLDVTRNSTIAVNTTAVLTNATCSVPTTSSLVPPTPSTAGNWTLEVTLGDCTVTQSIDTSSAISQFGVESDACSQKSNSTPVANPFASVVFWFYTVQQNGTPVATGIFCKPAIAAYGVTAVVDGATGLLVDVNITGNVDPNSNNVTGGTFAGKAFNGVSFDDSDFNLTNPFVHARALAVESGVPGAIFRVASDENQGGGLDAVFSNPTGFLGLTEHIYTQYLSLVALANYFTPAETSLNAIMTTWPNRLCINPRAAHFLATLLFLVAVSSAIIHFLHRRQRKGLYLASYPGSVAHYMSLLSHAQGASTTPTKCNKYDDDDAATLAGDSGFVGPLDSEKTMEEKLKGMCFMLDNTSGNIVTVPNRYQG